MPRLLGTVFGCPRGRGACWSAGKTVVKWRRLMRAPPLPTVSARSNRRPRGHRSTLSARIVRSGIVGAAGPGRPHHQIVRYPAHIQPPISSLPTHSFASHPCALSPLPTLFYSLCRLIDLPFPRRLLVDGRPHSGSGFYLDGVGHTHGAYHNMTEYLVKSSAPNLANHGARFPQHSHA